jgi:hypothetical protein
MRHRKLTQILGGRVAAAVFEVVAMVASGCSTQQNQSTPETQIQNLPAVASLDDYLAEGSNDASYMYVTSGPNDPFMIDPLWFASCWYSVPIYFPGGGQRHHHPPPTSAVAASPPRTEGMHTVVASAAASDPMESSHVGAFDGGMRGFGGGHMSGGRR